MNDCVKKYLRNIRFAFPIYRKNEKRFFNDFKSAVYEYEAGNSMCDEQDLINNFGSPKDVVSEYFDNMDPKTYLQLLRKSYYLKRFTIAAIFLLCVYFTFSMVSLYHSYILAQKNMIKTNEITIIYDTEVK